MSVLGIISLQAKQHHHKNNNFSNTNTKYWWNVSVSDGKEINISNIYHFTTRVS
jgi:hypothetical protein